jgi:uncharacterized repeat protein (TIGR01451 family)
VGPRPFAPGDLLVAVDGRILWYDDAGAEVLRGGIVTGPGLNTGMAFDPVGNLYVTRFSDGEVHKYGPRGQDLGAFGHAADGSNPLSGKLPESIAIARDGTVYVGAAEDGGDIYAFRPDGLLIAQYDVPTGKQAGADRIALCSDGSSLYYTTEDATVRRFDLATHVVVDPFATGLPIGRSFDLAPLPDGSLLVAAQQPDGAASFNSQVQRVGSGGQVVANYDTGSPGDLDRWYAVSVAADGQSFWAGDDGIGANMGRVVQFSLTATGSAPLRTLNTSARVTGLLAVPNPVADPDPDPDPGPSPGPTPSPTADLAVTLDRVNPASGDATVGQPFSYRMVVTNAGPDAAEAVSVTQALPAGLAFVSTTGGIHDSATSRFLLPIGTLAAGQSVEVTVTFRPTQSGMLDLDAVAITSTAESSTVNNSALLRLAAAQPVVVQAAPQLLSVQRTGATPRTTRIVLTFSQDLDPATAGATATYNLAPLVKRKGAWQPARAIALKSAQYDASTRTVTLTPRAALGMLARYRLTVGSALTGISGQLLAGATSADFVGSKPTRLV